MILVSCIMPTRGRHGWAQQALNAFLVQSYSNKELIIIDDHEDPSFLVPPRHRNVSHILIDSRLISEKRNYAARVATGEVLCHWDSDDWSAPWRIVEQLKHMEDTHKAVVGYQSMLFYDEDNAAAYYYNGSPLHPIGTSLFYLKSWWKDHQFTPGKDDPNVGEDSDFGKLARDSDQIDTRICGSTMVARIHSGNTSKKNPANPAQMEYRPVGLGKIPEAFFQ